MQFVICSIAGCERFAAYILRAAYLMLFNNGDDKW
jgi:hypothetical protein